MGTGPKNERDPNSSTIFVGNLSFNSTEDSIANLFSSCGAVKEVRIAYKDGKARGFAHVEFASTDAVDEAIKMVGTKLDGRPLNVDFSAARKPREGGNFGGNGGNGGYGGNGGNFGGNRRPPMRGGAPSEIASANKGSIQSFK